MLLCMVAAITAWAQTVITGTVVSAADGEPLIGASVKVKGEKVAAVTDLNGKFRISAEAGKTLVFSYIAMETVERAAKNGMYVEMTSKEEVMDEVMVVAFGTQKRSSFTGSAAVIDTKDLQKHTVTNVANALVGSVPGLQMRGAKGNPGAGAGSMSIRGISSLYADTEPLIILDGAPYPANLSNIPQEDIESITVLKDAASAALYGARGANGVILITTKKGKTENAEISLDVKWGANSRSVQDYDVIKSPAEYYETYYKGLYNKYYYNDGLSSSDAWTKANAEMLNQLKYNAYSVPNGELLIGKDGKINPNATLGGKHSYNGVDYYITPDDWTNEGYRSGFRQQYDLNMKGQIQRGGDYFLSFGYLNDDGYMKNTNYQRISARAKANYQVKKWLRVGANVGYTNSVNNGDPNLSNALAMTSYIAPIYPIYVRKYDANGNVVIATDRYGHQKYDYGTDYGNLIRPIYNTYNPFGSSNYDYNKTKGNTLNATLTADINFTDFLKFNATSTVTYVNSDATQLLNSFEGNKVSVNGQVIKEGTNTLRTNNVQTLTYFDRFGKHDINFMLGHEYYRMNTSFLQAVGQGLFSNEIPEISAAANNKFSSTSYSDMYNVEGFFGNLYYNYDEKYFLSASYRRDASSRFHKEHRWGNFWSGGVAWLMNKESFLADQKWIDNLKLKFSVGQQGSDGVPNFLYADLYKLTPVSDKEMAPTFYMKGNPEITWEKTTNINLGVDFSFWNGRLSGTVEYYNKLTSDQLFWMSIPETMGSRGYYGNMGDVRNSGVELTLNGSVIRTRDIEWTLYGNLAHNKNRIVSLPEDKFIDPENGYNGWQEDSKWLEEGKSIYNAFYTKYAGVNEKGQALYWVDEEIAGKTDRPGKNLSYTTTKYEEATFYECGDQMPAVFGGFGTTFSAYGFDLSMTFDYQIGGKIHDYRYAGLMGAPENSQNAGYNFHKDLVNAWSPSNTESNIPRFTYGDTYVTIRSDRWLTSASYLNFQSFTVGYTLPKKLTSKLGISKARLYCSGENLCFWSARQGLDPRSSFIETSSSNVYSPARTVMGGIQVTF